MASKANFRSTCGCERGAPECSSQRVPVEAPHVGQGTEDVCSYVSSLFFILDRMRLKIERSRESVQFWTLTNLSRR
jgi:hypothetical protein